MVDVGQWGPEPFLDRSGRPLTNLTITVYESDGTTLADLYTTQAGDTALANPLPTGAATTAAGLDVQGNGNFYAEPGPYELAVVYNGDEVYRSPITVGTDEDAVSGSGAVDSVNGQTGVVVLDATDVGADSTGTAAGLVATEAGTRATADALLIPLTQKAAANGVATLGADTLIPTNQLPPIALSEFKGLVACEAAMTALTAEPDDYYITADFDPDQWFLLTAAPASTAANWLPITANQTVDSVNGQVGVVSLAKTDVGLGNVDNTSDTNKPVSTAQQTAFDLKANLASPALSGTPTAPTPLAGDNDTSIATTAFVTGALTTAAAADDEIIVGVRTSPAVTVHGGHDDIGIDVSLTGGIAGGDTLNGGSGASETLTLGSTSHPTRGLINLRDRTLLVTEDQSSAAATPVVLMSVAATRTITLGAADYNAGNAATGFQFAPTILYSGNGPVTVSAAAFSDISTFKNSGARTNLAPATVVSNPTIIGDTTSHVISHVGLSRTPTVSITGGGTTSATLVDLNSNANVNTGATIVQRSGFIFTDAAGAGTVTAQTAIDIGVLAKGTTNIGIKNASTMVYPPSVAVLSAVGSSITPNARVKRLANTSGGALTLTSAPTMTDGIDGQIVTLFLPSGNAVTLSDQGTLASSNLRMSVATLTLSARDSITFMYSSDVGDWIQIMSANVI